MKNIHNIENEKELIKILKNKEKNQKYNYSINIINNNITHKISITIDEGIEICILSNNNESIWLQLENNRLFLNLKSDTENFKTDELLIFENKLNNKDYLYQIEYKNKLQNNLEKTILRIQGKQKNENQLKIIETKWKNDSLIVNKEKIVDGTIQEMAKQNEMGIIAIKHTLFLIDKILPFETDILSIILNNKDIPFLPKKRR